MPKLPDKPALIVYRQFWGNKRPKTYWTLKVSNTSQFGEEVQFNNL